MVFGIVPTFAIAASAGNTATTVSNFKYYYYEDFEDFTTDMTTDQIATKLGWTNWDADVADLKIVATAYVREITAKISGGYTTLQKALKDDNSDGTINALYWESSKVDGNGTVLDTEYKNINHCIVDVSALDAYDLKSSADTSKELDYTTLTTYTKRLLVIPKQANKDMSITLANGVDTANNNLYIDMDMAANKVTALGWTDAFDIEKGPGATASYASDSSMGLGVNFDNGAVYSQSWAVTGEMIYKLTNGQEVISSVKDLSAWCTGYNGRQQSFSMTYTKEDGKSDAVAENIYNHETSNGNCLSFDFRSMLTPDACTAHIRQNYANKSGYITDWSGTYHVSPSIANVSTAVASAYSASKTASVSLDLNNTGVSFYLDNIVVADNNGTAGSPVEITLDNVNTLVAGGAKVDVADLTADGKQCIYATVDGDVKYAGETVTLTEGMTITTGSSIDIDTRYGASMRLSDPTGLRWTTDINLEDLKALNDDTNISNVKVGTLITLTDNLAETAWEELTVGENVVDVAADLTALKAETADSNGNVCFNGSVVNIKSDNLEKEFSGIGYISMTVNGETVVIYGDYSAEAHSRNVHDLAQAALADVLTDEEKAAHAEGNKYTEALVAGDKYVVIDGDNVTIETFAENDEPLYSRYDTDERKVLLHFFGQ